MKLNVSDRQPDLDTQPCPPPDFCDECFGECVWRNPFDESLMCCSACRGSGVRLRDE